MLNGSAATGDAKMAAVENRTRPYCADDSDVDTTDEVAYYSLLVIIPLATAGAAVVSRNYVQARRIPLFNVCVVGFHTLDVMTDTGFYLVALTTSQFQCAYGDGHGALQYFCLCSIIMSMLIWIGRSFLMEIVGVGATGCSNDHLGEKRKKLLRLEEAYNKNVEKREQGTHDPAAHRRRVAADKKKLIEFQKQWLRGFGTNTLSKLHSEGDEIFTPQKFKSVAGNRVRTQQCSCAACL